MEQIKINGLQWDRENFADKGRRYFQFDEAQAAAKKEGKRLPSKEEFEALIELGSAWDNMRKGRWFGLDAEKLGKSDYSIFFPAWGSEGYNAETQELNGDREDIARWGFYYSSKSNGYWCFHNNDGTFDDTPVAQYRTCNWDRGYFGFSVRFVADAE